MKTIKLPGVSFHVSAICLGTAYFGSRDSEELARDVLDDYYGCGGRFLNTAHEYGYGASERVIGRWLRDRKNRTEMVITTKGGEDIKRPFARAMRRWELLEDADESLINLCYNLTSDNSIVQMLAMTGNYTLCCRMLWLKGVHRRENPCVLIA